MKVLIMALLGTTYLSFAALAAPASADVVIDNSRSWESSSVGRTIGLVTNDPAPQTAWTGVEFMTGNHPHGYYIKKFTPYFMRTINSFGLSYSDLSVQLALYKPVAGVIGPELVHVEAGSAPSVRGPVAYDNLGAIGDFTLLPSTKYALAVQTTPKKPITGSFVFINFGWHLAGDFSSYATNDDFSPTGVYQYVDSSWSYITPPTNYTAMIYQLDVAKSATPLGAAVPVPLPVIGSAVALGFSRKLRKRLRNGVQAPAFSVHECH